MKDDESNWRNWRSKSDEEVADAARHLSDYTEEAQRIIREELRFRGFQGTDLLDGSIQASADPSPTKGPINESRSPVLNRYQDAYRVGAALVGLGNTIKIVGAVLAGIIVLGSLSAGSEVLTVAGVVLAAIGGGLFWVCGVIVAAQGQILQATLDNAVASSHFLTDAERADAMGLPRSVAGRSGA
ncbi:MAG: hypothetical protein AABN33_01025 [Acidobacteriota bacterium]